MMRFLLLFAIVAFGVAGCKDPLHDYQECVDIETARCRLRASCVGVSSFDKEFPNFDENTCVAYAKEHCRTRKIHASGFTRKQVDDCIDAIAQVPCENLAMNTTETMALSECAFLTAPVSSDTESQPQTSSDSAVDTQEQTESPDSDTAT